MIKKFEVNIGAIWFDKDTKTLQVAATVPFGEFSDWRLYVCQLVESNGIYRRPYFLEQEKADCDDRIDDVKEEDWSYSDTILHSKIINLALEIVGVLKDSVWWDDGDEAARAIIG